MLTALDLIAIVALAVVLGAQIHAAHTRVQADSTRRDRDAHATRARVAAITDAPFDDLVTGRVSCPVCRRPWIGHDNDKCELIERSQS